MKKNIENSVRIQSVNLYSVNALKNNIPQREYTINVDIEPSLEEENEKTISILCKIALGSEEHPFKITMISRAVFKKLNSINGEDLVKNFFAVSNPVLSEMSLSVAQIVSAMGYPTLIIPPQEIASSKTSE